MSNPPRRPSVLLTSHLFSDNQTSRRGYRRDSRERKEVRVSNHERSQMKYSLIRVGVQIEREAGRHYKLDGGSRQRADRRQLERRRSPYGREARRRGPSGSQISGVKDAGRASGVEVR